METVSIRRAALADIEALISLLDAYRQHFGRESDLQATRRFLLDRFERSESIVFLALLRREPVGFVQLYPCFSTLSLRRTFILNDLYVDPKARRQGIGHRLMDVATTYARQHGAVRLTLPSGTGETTAERVYRKYGWERNEGSLVYELRL